MGWAEMRPLPFDPARPTSSIPLCISSREPSVLATTASHNKSIVSYHLLILWKSTDKKKHLFLFFSVFSDTDVLLNARMKKQPVK
jgi:hypothetical protein